MALRVYGYCTGTVYTVYHTTVPGRVATVHTRDCTVPGLTVQYAFWMALFVVLGPSRLAVGSDGSLSRWAV